MTAVSCRNVRFPFVCVAIIHVTRTSNWLRECDFGFCLYHAALIQLFKQKARQRERARKRNTEMEHAVIGGDPTLNGKLDEDNCERVRKLQTHPATPHTHRHKQNTRPEASPALLQTGGHTLIQTFCPAHVPHIIRTASRPLYVLAHSLAHKERQRAWASKNKRKNCRLNLTQLRRQDCCVPSPAPPALLKLNVWLEVKAELHERKFPRCGKVRTTVPSAGRIHCNLT